MRKITYLLLFCAFIATAQSPIMPKLEAKFQVYFESGLAELDDKSNRDLEQFLKKYEVLLAEHKVYIKLQAFTDDVGSKAVNDEIAVQRAESVQKVLIELGIDPEELEVLVSEQLNPNPAQNIAAQRRQSRRVEIKCYATPLEDDFEPMIETEAFTMASFFETEREKARQYFSFEDKTGMIIKGEKGTILQIPPHSFVYADGTVFDGQVIFTLQEIYSNADLILQNAATMSEGKMLETGGSFYILAADLSGKQLSLKQGSVIKASLPTEEASLPGMEVFTGSQTTDGRVEWQATASPVQPLNIKFENNSRVGKSYSTLDFDNYLSVFDDIPQVNHLPKDIKKPRFYQRAPKQPSLKEIVKPSRATLYEKYPQKTKESTLAYRKRLQEKYKKEASRYRMAMRSNAKKMYEFRRDSLSYLQAKTQFDADLLAYYNYNETMKLRITELDQLLKDFSFDKYVKACNQMSIAFLKPNERFNSVNDSYLKLKDGLLECKTEGLAVSDLFEDMESIVLPKYRKQELSRLEEMSMMYKHQAKLGLSIKFYKTWYYNTSHVSIAKLQESISKTIQRINERPELSVYNKNKVRFHYETLNRLCDFYGIEATGKYIRKNYARNKPLVEKFINSEAEVKALQDAFLNRKNELGLLSTEEIAESYGNVMNITTMGWINCDRFYDKPDEIKADIQILAEYDPNTAIFVVFEDIRSVIQATYDKNKGVYIVSNIPSEQSVKVVGLKMRVKDAEVFVEKGTVSQLSKLQPSFQAKSLAAAKKMMDEV